MVIQKITEKTKKFHSEFRNQVSTALITAFGLVIALGWKDVVVDLMSKLNPLSKSNLFISAIIVTILGIIGIAIVSKWVKSPEPAESSSQK